MKTYKYIFTFSFVLISIFLHGCSNDISQSDKKYNHLPSYVLGVSSYSHIGDWHTTGMQYMKDHYNLSATYAQTGHPAMDTMVLMCARAFATISPDTVFSAFDTTNEISNIYDLYYVSPPTVKDYQKLKDYWNSNKNSASIISLTSSIERAYVDSLISFKDITVYPGFTRVQICDSMISKVNAMITNFNSQGWGTGGGSLAGGMLYTALSSANFLKTHYANNSSDTTQPPFFFAMDGLGYIWGWVEDGVRGTSNDQWGRINSGGKRAVEVSTGALIWKGAGGSW